MKGGFGIGSGGTSGERSVEDRRRGENHLGFGDKDGADSHLWGVGLNGNCEFLCGGEEREAKRPYGKQPTVGVEPS
jgi:hypothetical protein